MAIASPEFLLYRSVEPGRLPASPNSRPEDRTEMIRLHVHEYYKSFATGEGEGLKRCLYGGDDVAEDSRNA
jgi:hypothetical protein